MKESSTTRETADRLEMVSHRQCGISGSSSSRFTRAPKYLTGESEDDEAVAVSALRSITRVNRKEGGADDLTSQCWHIRVNWDWEKHRLRAMLWRVVVIAVI